MMKATCGDGQHDDGDARHEDGNGQQGDRRHEDGEGWHDDFKNYCSCTPGKWICKNFHGGHFVAELKCLEHKYH